MLCRWPLIGTLVSAGCILREVVWGWWYDWAAEHNAFLPSSLPANGLGLVTWWSSGNDAKSRSSHMGFLLKLTCPFRVLLLCTSSLLSCSVTEQMPGCSHLVAIGEKAGSTERWDKLGFQMASLGCFTNSGFLLNETRKSLYLIKVLFVDFSVSFQHTLNQHPEFLFKLLFATDIFGILWQVDDTGWEQASRYLQNINVYIVTFLEPPYRKKCWATWSTVLLPKTSRETKPPNSLHSAKAFWPQLPSLSWAWLVKY